MIASVAVLLLAAPAARADDSVAIPIDRGVQHVQQEIAGVELFGGPTPPREQLAAQSALTYVQARLSPAVHAAIGGGADLTTAFQLQSGLCGDIVEAFMQILQRVGVRTLPVQWFYTVGGVRQNHVAAQVWWRGRWHYVDPTWGVLFERDGAVLSPEQVAKLKRPRRHAVMNNLVPWTYANARRGGGWDPLSYLTRARARQIVMNGAGTIRPPRTGATWDLSLTPDYVGTYVPYAGQLVAIRQRLVLPAGRHVLTLESKGKLCGGLGVLHVGPVDIPFASVPDAGPLTVRLGAATTTVTLWVDGGDPAEPCAVLLAGISAS